MRNSLFIMTILCSVACGSSGSDAKKATAPETGSDETIVDAAASADVTGSYLVACGETSEAPTTFATEGFKTYGCALVDKNNQKVSGEISDFQVSVTYSGGEPVAPESIPATGSAKWLVFVRVPVEKVATVSTFSGKAVVAGASVTIASAPKGAYAPEPAVVAAPPAAAPTGAPIRMFVTPGNYPRATDSARFLEEAATACQSEATKGAIAPTAGRAWTAFIATPTQGPRDRLVLDGPLVNLKGESLGSSDSLWNGTFDETKVTFSSGAAAVQVSFWSGATGTGALGATCEGWAATAAPANFALGRIHSAHSTVWLEFLVKVCDGDTQAAFLCIEQ